MWFSHTADEFNRYDEKSKADSLYMIILTIIAIIGIILRSINLNQSFWLDEIESIVNFIKPFRLWRYIDLSDHWLYSLLGFLNIRLFGETEVIMRLPAFIFAIITIYAIYYFAIDFLSKREALLASVLLCISASHIRYSFEAKGYSALALFGLFSSHLFLKFIFNKYPLKRRKEIFLFGISTTLGLLSHFYYIWVLFSQCFTILVIGIFLRKKIILLKDYQVSSLLTAMAAGSLTAFIIYGPSIIPVVIKKYILWKGVGEVISFRTVGRLLTGSPGHLHGIFFTVLIFFGLIDFLRNQREVLFFYFIFLVGLPLIIVRIICKATFYHYFIFTLPFLILLLAHSMSILAQRFKSVYLRFIVLSMFMATFIITQLPALTSYYRHRKSGVQDYRSVGQLIDTLAKKGDTILAFGIGRKWAQYYIKKHKVRYFDDFNEQEFYQQVDSGSSKIWLIVTYPEYIHLCPEAKMYEFARKRLRLLGYFPGFGSDLNVYGNQDG